MAEAIKWPERFLGDGVYASFDGYQIWLKTSGGVNRQGIAIEPEVLKALNEYDKELHAFALSRVVKS